MPHTILLCYNIMLLSTNNIHRYINYRDGRKREREKIISQAGLHIRLGSIKSVLHFWPGWISGQGGYLPGLATRLSFISLDCDDQLPYPISESQ